MELKLIEIYYLENKPTLYLFKLRKVIRSYLHLVEICLKVLKYTIYIYIELSCNFTPFHDCNS